MSRPQSFRTASVAKLTVADLGEHALLAETDVIDKNRPRGKNVGRAERLYDAPGRYVAFVKQTFPQDLTLEGLRLVWERNRS